MSIFLVFSTYLLILNLAASGLPVELYYFIIERLFDSDVLEIWDWTHRGGVVKGQSVLLTQNRVLVLYQNNWIPFPSFKNADGSIKLYTDIGKELFQVDDFSKLSYNESILLQKNYQRYGINLTNNFFRSIKSGYDPSLHHPDWNRKYFT